MELPPLDYLQESLSNFSNLSRVTASGLLLNPGRNFIQDRAGVSMCSFGGGGDLLDIPRMTKFSNSEAGNLGLEYNINMEEFVLYADSFLPSDVGDLSKMTKNRASRGAKLSPTRFVDTRGGE